MDSEVNVLDLSNKSLKKIPKTDDAQSIKVLLLDDNDLQKIDNIDSYLKIEKLSLTRNQLLRMYGVSRLHNLRDLNLAYNGILTIEALKECIHLTHLNLEGNQIKSIEHLNTNLKLEFLNLGENSIGIISDISFLKCLKELHLHSNRISHLRQCERFLPQSLEVLTLAKNQIADLNELCTLSNLSNLSSITVCDNPCVQMTGNHSIGFDYRPFVLNWCMSVKAIDGYVVNPIESLKAEWLYSQGKGRSFRVGEHLALAQHLSQVCPLSGEALENENERKLRLILSKAQQHQRQLHEQNVSGSNPTTPNNSSTNNSPSSLRRKGPPSRIQSPRITRLSGRPSSSDSMSSSFHGIPASMTNSTIENNHSNQLLEMTKSLIDNFTSDSLMTQSLDPNIFGTSSMNTSMKESQHSPLNNGNYYNEMSFNHSLMQSMGPLQAASKMMPVPESLMSPDCAPSPTIHQQRPVSNLTTSTTNYMTSSMVKTVKVKDNRAVSASSKSPRSTPRKPEKSSPSQSPRKAISNTSNVRIHNQQQQHTMMKHHAYEVASSVMSTDQSEDDDDSDKINFEKIKSIRKTAQKCQKQKENAQQIQQQSQHKKHQQLMVETKKMENSVVLIQKLWRGYATRKRTKSIAEVLQQKRTQDYVVKLSKDMEMTKQALENERKIQQLQMQAINALWKKVSNMNPENGSIVTTTAVVGENGGMGFNADSATIVQDLTKTCSMLTNQVQQLQLSMRDILNCMTLFTSLPQMQQMTPQQSASASNMMASQFKDSNETQTEIIAVHTPQIEHPQNFPFMAAARQQHPTRPCTLPITSSTDSSISAKSSQQNTATTTDDFENQKALGEIEEDKDEEEPPIVVEVYEEVSDSQTEDP